MKRMLAMLLSAMMTCLCLGGALAEDEADYELTVQMVPELKAVYDEHPATGAELDKEGVAAVCEALYGWIDPEKVGGFFYGGPEETTALIRDGR